MVQGWGDTTIPWDPRPFPGTAVQGKDGTLESVRVGRGEKAPLPPWVWSQKSLSLQLTLHRGAPIPAPPGGWPVPRNNKFSVSHLEILNTISFFLFLLQGSPLHRGACCPAEPRALSPSWDMASQKDSACPFPPAAPLSRHDALLLVTPGLGLSLCLVSHAKHRRVEHTQPPAALPEGRKSFIPMQQQSWWVP